MRAAGMERALDASVSVLSLERSQKICCGVEYRLFVLLETLAVRRLRRRHLGLHHARRDSVLRVLVPVHARKRYGIQASAAPRPRPRPRPHPQNSHHGRPLLSSRGRHLFFLPRPPGSHWRLLSSCSSSSVIWIRSLCLLVSLSFHVASTPRLATGDAEFSTTSESCSLTYHFVVPGSM